MAGMVEQVKIAGAEIINNHLDPIFGEDLLPIAIRGSQDLIIKEGGDKFNGHHPDALRRHNPAGKDRIKSPGKKGQGGYG